MSSLKIDTSKIYGEFKPMNAVNNGPCHRRHVNDQKRTNLEAYTTAKIPYARNHDASFDSWYGSEHSVDITGIFPDFNADPYDAKSYDFVCTDEYIEITRMAGTETFYRLGQRIEHYVKKFGTIPPKDFQKWAVICEHIIRHYNEGWANGFHFDIKYWEIWNEPDLDLDDDSNKRTWGGTMAQFFDLYEVTAKRLKGCFPYLKIGGPALAGREEWAEEFLQEMQKRSVPIDFFSWHIYCKTPQQMIEKAERIKRLLIENGYEKAESILNEWNYVKGWIDEFVYSVESIHGMKGAAFTMACMTEAQKSSIDMLMYYDARPSVFNGLFDYYTLRPLKGYYPFLWFSELNNLSEIRSKNQIDDIYTLCGVDGENKVKAIVTYYTDEENMPNKTVKLDFGKTGKYEIYELSADKTNELTGISETLELTMQPNSCLLVKEI